MSIHNRLSMEAMPLMVNMAKFFEVYDDAAKGFKQSVETADLHKAAEYQAVMFRLDCWFSEHRLEL